MATTTPAKVKNLTGSKLDDATVQPFVEAAGVFISEYEETAGVSAAIANLAADYMGCHLLVTSPVGRASAETKREDIQGMLDTEFNVAKPDGMGIMSTNWGAFANNLMNGVLLEAEKPAPGMFAVGAL